MAGNVLNPVSGKWRRYKLEPADLDLAVYAGTSPSGGVRVAWKGHPDIGLLMSFFEKAVEQVSSPLERHLRSWFLNRDGPKSFNSFPGNVPRDTREAAEFVRFECFRKPPASEADVGDPVIVVAATAGLDKEARSLEDTQESGAIYLRQLDDLGNLGQEIAEVVASTDSRFFSHHHPYRPEAVLQRLREAGNDIRAG